MPNNNPIGINQFTKGVVAGKNARTSPKNIINRINFANKLSKTNINKEQVKKSLTRVHPKTRAKIAQSLVEDMKSGRFKSYSREAKKTAIADYRMVHPKKSK